MKKIIAILLAFIMMFSMSSATYAVDNTVAKQISSVTVDEGKSASSIDNYIDYLEAKLNDNNTNFFVRIIVRLVIIGVMLGIIKPKDFDEWFENNVPDADTDKGSDNTTEEDNNTSTNWEDGTELKLYTGRSFPYTQDGITIKNMKVTKEHYNGYRVNPYGREIAQKYRYAINMEGSIQIDKINCLYYLDFELFSDSKPAGGGHDFCVETRNSCDIDSTFTIDDNGNFVFVAYQYNIFEDYDSYFIGLAFREG